MSTAPRDPQADGRSDLPGAAPVGPQRARATTPERDPELERLRAELQSARDALGDFAYGVSHDLRAQLRHILSYSTLLREELGPTLGSEPAQFLDVIQQAAQTLGRQIDGLKAWAQLDRIELQLIEVDLSALLAEVWAGLEPERAGRAITWALPAGLPRARADGVLLRQLFTHLLSNACKFTRPTSQARVTVWAEAGANAGGMLTLHIEDNGVGFAPGQEARLFRVFQRLHTTREFEGLGLGLALAQKIAHRLGGAVSLAGRAGAGCRVSVTLPLATSA